eukprot:CAMPEP_0178933852 /NCGR_PEP_ID=MMETSP0786-20121207/23524_1 /TAXON_ID=186022 /ORGANISM="Thalassionema frauenfeldii, Strain CCMP 1798" /LENGTH=43 /DNA_ID= /DNA_START= /DNA_END= /DNA_ORIENTATION=
MVNEESEASKAAGDELFKAQKYAEAVKKYKKAAKIDPTCAIFS